MDDDEIKDEVRLKIRDSIMKAFAEHASDGMVDPADAVTIATGILAEAIADLTVRVRSLETAMNKL